ncbi:MAG: heavy metal translocating P-type ATPase [Elusimicrobiales bacterium]|nr:heavy metal translocating P-type ATPase [Elusimicrobiales bacterium]
MGKANEPEYSLIIHSAHEIGKASSLYFKRFVIALLVFFASAAGEYIGFSRLVFCVLAFIAWAFAGWHFHKGYFEALRIKKADMNTLVSISSSVMFFYNLAITVFPDLASIYVAAWHYMPMMLAFANFGLWSECKYKKNEFDSAEKMFRIAPAFARRLGDRGEEIIPARDVKAGDLLLIRPAEQLSADGHVTKGISSVDEGQLTGESMPAAKAAGSRVYAGTINQTGWLEFVADAVGEDTAIMRIAIEVIKSRSGRAASKRISDKIAAWFMPFVFFAAFASAVAWMLFSWDYRMSLGVFVSVLSAACPLAIGITVPFAVGIGFMRSKKLGVHIRNAEIVDAAKTADTVIFDKTGTLTDGTLQLKLICPEGISEEEFFRLMAIAESKSEHPLAAAVRRASEERKIYPSGIMSYTSLPGRGVKATFSGGDIAAGSLQWLESLNVAVPENIVEQSEKSSCSMLLLALNGEYKGYASFSSRLRPNAAKMIQTLKKMKIQPVLASGDSRSAVQAAANETGIEIFHYGVFPAAKRDIICGYKSKGNITVMVGDGFNDAPALAAADIGISMRSGSGLAAEASDVTLMHDDLHSVISALLILKRIRTTIKQNASLAFIFSALYIPVAAGVLYPVCGWIAQPKFLTAFSLIGVLAVIINSMRLNRMKI